jgi:hypothetical protein
MTAENKMRFTYWTLEAIKLMKKYKADRKNETLWGALNCAGACMCEYDRKHTEPATEAVQRFLWEEGFLRGETSFERYFNSGYFNEKYAKRA